MEDWEINEQLHFAAMDNSIDKVKSLVSEGNQLDYFDVCGKTAFHYAVEQENFQIAQFLLECGIDVNSQDVDQCGCTPLGNVGATCTLKMAKFLVKHGANPLTPGWMGISAIDRARDRKKPEGVKVYEYLLNSAKT